MMHLTEFGSLGLAVLGLGAALAYTRLMLIDRVAVQKRTVTPVIQAIARDHWFTAVGLVLMNLMMVIVALLTLDHVTVHQPAAVTMPEVAERLMVSGFAMLKWHLRVHITAVMRDDSH